MNKEQIIQFRSDLDLARRAELAVLDHVIKIWDNFGEGIPAQAPPGSPPHPLAEQLKTVLAAKEDPLAESQTTTGGSVKPTPRRAPGQSLGRSPVPGSGRERVREWACSKETSFTMKEAVKALGLSHSAVSCAFLHLLSQRVIKRLGYGTYERVPVVAVPAKDVAGEYSKFRESLGPLKVPRAGSHAPAERGDL